MVILNPRTYDETLELCYKTKDGLLVLGPPGIGKSAIPLQVFPRIAKKNNREFVVWDKVSRDKKLEVMVYSHLLIYIVLENKTILNSHTICC